MKSATTLLILLFISFPVDAAEVTLRKEPNGGWKLLVDKEPYFIRGMDYRVTRIGESPDHGSLKDWAFYDDNGNGRSDGPYDAWVDEDGDGRRTAGEWPKGDFLLMKEMGVNTIRWYVNDFPNQKANKALLRDLFETHGIRVAVGDKFGAYTIGSGATWEAGTDYRNPEQKKRMLESVRRMVEEHKNEPYTLLWLLGNENNLRFTNTNAGQFPDDYAKFVNEAAELIHSLDPHHPVALVNGDVKGIHSYRKFAPAVDIFGVNCYRGEGFGSLWKEVKKLYGKPVLVTEYGGTMANGRDETKQAMLHRACWLDIAANRSNRLSGAGNSLGGFAFEWMDEWWKAGEPSDHAAVGTVGKQGVGAAGWPEEWCGLFSQGDGSLSPFYRKPRRVYYLYKDELWNENTNW